MTKELSAAWRKAHRVVQRSFSHTMTDEERDAIIDECADIANYCAMIAALARRTKSSSLDPTKEQWCWAEPDSEQATGPFDSKEDAILEASNSIGEPGVDIHIGRCLLLKPEEWVHGGMDLDDVVDRITEFAGDNEWFTDRPMFDTKVGAEDALHEAMRVWAREWLMPLAWRMADDYTSEVTVDVNAGAEMQPRDPGCTCHLEEGDSPCPVHGDESA